MGMTNLWTIGLTLSSASAAASCTFWLLSKSAWHKARLASMVSSPIAPSRWTASRRSVVVLLASFRIRASSSLLLFCVRLVGLEVDGGVGDVWGAVGVCIDCSWTGTVRVSTDCLCVGGGVGG